MADSMLIRYCCKDLLGPADSLRGTMNGQPWLFKWRQFEAEIIVCAVRWYLRYSLSYREVQELLAERGINVDHSTIWRWVQRYAPELALRQRAHLKPTNKSWRVDETYVRVKGEWCYLYRAVDSEGATVEFLMSAFRDKESAQSLFRRAIGFVNLRRPVSAE